MTILLTGFNPFQGSVTNSSEIVVSALQGYKTGTGHVVRTAILRTEYEFAGAEIVRLIRDVEPAAVVSLGMQAMDNRIRVERLAQNWDNCAFADNAGVMRQGQPIVYGAPASFVATLPIEKLFACLNRHDIGAAISSDAGNYVCNHVFFRACRELSVKDSSIPCGFIHIPPISEFPTATKIGLPLDTILTAVRICVEELLS